MKNQKEHNGNRVRWHVLVISLLIMGNLYVCYGLYGWQKFRPMSSNAITLSSTTEPTAPLVPQEITPSQPTNSVFVAVTQTSLPTSIFTAIPSMITFLPLRSSPTPKIPGSNVITLTGTTNVIYSPKVPNNTFFDATNWTSTAIGPNPNGTTGKGVDIYGINNSFSGVTNITWRGGVIIGSIPQSWSWRLTHDFGGAGIFIHNAGPIEWQYLRIHNVEDGIKPKEVPEYSNTGSWILRDSYFTAIRDDAIENDRFEPGTVQDCLFDGVYVFMSEQDENVGSNNPIGPNEDNTIYIKRVYVRLYGTNAAEGPGKWFKWKGNGPHHKLEVSDSVFAIGSVPRLGWPDETTTLEVRWVGNNNFILWLGAPGEYGGSKPVGVTFLEGADAQDKWISVREEWLTEHGLPSQSFPADYNPFDAPVMQIPPDF